jgi:branched-chain amino acid transport system permease protein/neutral amino acid transport system permease protein
LVSLIVYGIVEGSIIALGAIGLTLLFGILRFLHFAHGDLMTLGAYLSLFMLDLLALAGLKGGAFPYLSFGYPLLAAMLVAMLLTAGITILINRILYRPLRLRQSHSVVLGMSSLGVAFMLLSLINIIWGPQLNLYSSAIQRAIKLPLSIKIKPDQIFIVAAAIILGTLVYFFLEKTKIGKAMRASSDNLDLAEVTGINTERVVTWTWGIGGALTAAAGTLYAIDTQLMPIMGWNLLLPVFAAAILGGIGNPYGAMVSGLIIGVVENVSTMIIPHDYKTAVSFILIIVLLLLKPSGLFGRK